jgi:hypothetical protein
MEKRLPRFVIAKVLTSGQTAFYFNIPTYYRKLGCTIPNEPLGGDYTVACGEKADGGRAAALNGLFDEWNTQRQGKPFDRGALLRFGTVDWVFREYKSSKAYLEKVAVRSRPDYERTMLLVADVITKKGDRLGNRSVRSITPRAADKIYDRVIQGKDGLRLRQGEKAIAISVGLTTGARHGRTRSGLSTTRPVNWSGTRWKKSSTASGPRFTPMRRRCWRKYRAAAHR